MAAPRGIFCLATRLTPVPSQLTRLAGLRAIATADAVAAAAAAAVKAPSVAATIKQQQPKRDMSLHVHSHPATPSNSDGVEVTIDAHRFATVTLNRPDDFNSIQNVLIVRLTHVFQTLKQDPTIRGMFLRSTGRFFCAGADLKWMQATVNDTMEQNYQDARNLGQMLYDLYTLPFPTIAIVQGPAFGGGVGLIACCDMAYATSKSHFTLSEVKLGLLPATISPYVVAKIGAPQARRYILTAERFSADQAKTLSLVNEVVETEQDLEKTASELLKTMVLNSPSAVRASKRLIYKLSHSHLSQDELLQTTAQALADQRVSTEGQEGLKAFFEKRKPSWAK
eukprot:m.71165 g.71165  ORF g.71165 m.71165 type:complete len:338 (+) comp14349_c0_seq1:66-1079(+)